MAGLIDDVVHLTQEIGPRPAGTEEEQQAALFVADELQKEAGFSTVIEDFVCAPNADIIKLVCYVVAFLCSLISLIFPVAAVPSLIIAILVAVISVLDVFDRPILERFLSNGVSQNVVAKYQPAVPNETQRRRKVILVANYDSGKAQPEYRGILGSNLKIVRIALAVPLVLAPLALFIKTVFFLSDAGVASLIFNVIIVLCMILMVFQLALLIMPRIGAYTQGANNNAAGVAVMLDVARSVGQGLVSNEELAARAQDEGVTVHGEEAAYQAQVVPDGAKLEYDVSREKQMSPSESLAAAKAAIEALTGQPVADKVPVTDISSKLVQHGNLEPDPELEEQAAAVHFEVSEPVVTPEPQRTFTPRERIEAEEIKRQKEAVREEEKKILAEQQAREAAAQQAAAQQQFMGVQQTEGAVQQEAGMQPSVVGIQNAVQDHSFERTTPEALQSRNTGVSAPVDRTPAWAKVAQAKAHANKPEESRQSTSVGRSKFADTVAAQITAASTPLSPFVASTQSYSTYTSPSNQQATRQGAASMWGQAQSSKQAQTQTTAEAEEPQSPLAARLASLRSEIESVEAPHLSKETKSAIDHMESEQQASAAQPVVIRPVATQQATEQPVVQATTRPVVSQQPVTTQTQATEPVVSQPVEQHPISQQAQSREQVEVQEVSQTPTPTAPMPAKEVTQTVQQQTAQQGSANMPASHQPASGVSVSQRSSATRISAVSEPHESATNASVSQGVGTRIGVAPTNQPQPHVAQQQTEDKMSAGKTSAISPIDVSQYLDKESGNDAVEAMQERAAAEAQVSPEKAVATSLPTAPVSKEEVKQALEEAETHVDEIVENQQDQPAQTASHQAENIEEPLRQVVEQTLVEPTRATPTVEVSRQNAAEQGDAQQKSVPVAPPIVGLENIASKIPTIDPQESQENHSRHVIVLPEVSSQASLPEENKQRAPMADSAKSTKSGSKALLSNMLPRIDTVEEKPTDHIDTFGLNIPTIEEHSNNSAVSATGSFSTVGGTGSLAPVGDELVADIAPEDRYVEDADDSAYDEDFTETGAFAGPGYVDMPKSRVGRFFDRFHSKKKKKNKKQEEVSVNEWIDADDSYEARSVGKARGSWESFREDNYDEAYDDTNENNENFVDVDYDDDFDNNRGWRGGAFSLGRLQEVRDRVSSKMHHNEEAAPSDEYLAATTELDDDMNVHVESRPVASSSPVSPVAENSTNDAEQINRELMKINDFRHPDIDTEVWFVALGAELANHGGMHAFIKEHEDELKGAIFINLESLGAGRLTYIEEEGALMTKKPSSRLKRFMRQAQERSGVSFSISKLFGRDTSATIAMKHGYQGASLVGMDGGQPVGYVSVTDEFEEVDEQTLKDNAKFVLSVLKSV